MVMGSNVSQQDIDNDETVYKQQGANKVAVLRTCVWMSYI